MKTHIPQEHYELYRQIYKYLHHTLGAELDCYPDWDLERQVVGNYISEHHRESHLTQSIEGSNDTTVDDSEQSVAIQKISRLHQEISQCHNCFLGALRKQYVKLPPYPQYPIMIVTDIPSFYDQAQGDYFTDEAGTLLKKILQSIGLNIKSIYYTSTIKCSSSQEITNRLSETLPCQKHFTNEIALIKPQFIIGFGKTTYDLLMLDEAEIKNQEFIDSELFSQHVGKSLSFHGIDIVFTYHPRDLLIDPSLKKITWEHLRKWTTRISEIKNSHE